LTLLLIAALTAGMLAAVNEFTKDRIAKNAQEKTVSAVASIVGEYDEMRPLDTAAIVSPVTEVYDIKRSGETVAFGVFVSPSGYGGKIDMLVIVSPDMKVVGVSVISMSETPGLGSSATEEGYLNGYIGMDGTAKLGEDIDIIAGATRTSKAIFEGVKAAVAAVSGGADSE